MSVDYAHTRTAEANRERKASALAAEAQRQGLMPFELQPTGVGGDVDERRRERVRKAAGIDRAPSAETWDRALEVLEIAVFQVPGITLCAACDWAVLRVTTLGGRDIDIDPLPRDDGSVALESAKAGAVVAVVYAGGAADRPVGEPMYRQHSRSCPQAPAARRVRLARCEVCNLPLYARLVGADPTYTTHPTCDPREPEP